MQALHTEIKGKKEKVEDVNKNADTCATSIKVGVQTVFTFLLHVFFYKLHQQLSNKTVTQHIVMCVFFYLFTGLRAAAGFLQLRLGNSAQNTHQENNASVPRFSGQTGGMTAVSP